VQVRTSVPRCIPHLGKPPAFGVWVGSVIRSPPGLRMTSPGPLLEAAGRGPPPKNELVEGPPYCLGHGRIAYRSVGKRSTAGA